MDRTKPRKELLAGVSDPQAAGLRLFLAIIALIVLYFDGANSQPYLGLLYAIVLIYVLYSGLIYVATRQVGEFSRAGNTALVGVDAVLLSFMSLTSTLNDAANIFFLFYFFLILFAHSRLGPKMGIFVTFLAVGLFVAANYFHFSQVTPPWDRLILRSATLVALSYVLTYWARAEKQLQQKLEFLGEVSSTANPRFGVNRTANQLMKRLLEFFNADTCALVEYEQGSDDYQARVANIWSAERDDSLATLPQNIRMALETIARGNSVLYRERGTWKRQGCCLRWTSSEMPERGKPCGDALVLARWLYASSFLIVPLRHHEWFRGYVILASGRPSAFTPDDAKFMLQVADQVAPVLDHIRLVDRMASDAASDERQRIARSVHDRVIQPYIGLHMGLIGARTSLRSLLQPLAQDEAALETRQALDSLDRLVSMAHEGVEELRQYVYDLRKTKERGDLLVNSILRYAQKFEAVTGIQVKISASLKHENISDRLAAEVFHMTTEALSNVHRHTTATEVDLSIQVTASGSIAVRIANEAKAIPAASFEPKSITERSVALGGQTQVSTADGMTFVDIEIPL